MTSGPELNHKRELARYALFHHVRGLRAYALTRKVNMVKAHIGSDLCHVVWECGIRNSKKSADGRGMSASIQKNLF